MCFSLGPVVLERDLSLFFGGGGGKELVRALKRLTVRLMVRQTLVQIGSHRPPW